MLGFGRSPGRGQGSWAGEPAKNDLSQLQGEGTLSSETTRRTRAGEWRAGLHTCGAARKLWGFGRDRAWGATRMAGESARPGPSPWGWLFLPLKVARSGSGHSGTRGKRVSGQKGRSQCCGGGGGSLAPCPHLAGSPRLPGSRVNPTPRPHCTADSDTLSVCGTQKLGDGDGVAGSSGVLLCPRELRWLATPLGAEMQG